MLDLAPVIQGNPLSPTVRQGLYFGRGLGNLFQTLRRILLISFKVHLIQPSDSRLVLERSSTLISPIFRLSFIRKAHGLDNSTWHWHCYSRISGQSSSHQPSPAHSPTSLDVLTDGGLLTGPRWSRSLSQISRRRRCQRARKTFLQRRLRAAHEQEGGSAHT